MREKKWFQRGHGGGVFNFHQPEPGEYCVEHDGGWKNILLVAKALLPVVKSEQARLVLSAATELGSL